MVVDPSNGKVNRLFTFEGADGREYPMRKSDLRNKAIHWIKRFALTEEEIDDLIHAGEYRYDPDCEDGEAYALIKSMIELLPENKRHDLMCLMYLGRNLDYYGLNEEVIDDFCAYADDKTKTSGSTDPQYLAGKVPLAWWLRLVKKRIQPDFWYIGTRYDGNVKLRDITENDAEFMMKLVGDPKVTKFIPGMIQDREMLVSWIGGLDPLDHECIITIEETEEEIGECSLTEQGTSGEIGFMFLPQFWCKGYGTETVHSLMNKARGLGIKELTATTDSRNKAAIRLLEKTGFKKQKSGWMVMIPEDEVEQVGDGQMIIQFQRNI